jgi:hypothetical protein
MPAEVAKVPRRELAQQREVDYDARFCIGIFGVIPFLRQTIELVRGSLRFLS